MRQSTFLLKKWEKIASFVKYYRGTMLWIFCIFLQTTCILYILKFPLNVQKSTISHGVTRAKSRRCIARLRRTLKFSLRMEITNFVNACSTYC